MRHATVVLLHPSPIIKAGIENLVLRHKEISVSLVEATIDNFSEIVSKKKPSLIITDPVIISPASIDSIRDILPDTHIIAIYTSALPHEYTSKFDDTMSIYDTPDVLFQLLTRALERNDDNLDNDRKELSPREKEVVVGIVKGLSNKEIAGAMNVSVNTVMTHRRNISGKLKIHSPAGLTIYAIVSKLVSLEEVSGL